MKTAGVVFDFYDDPTGDLVKKTFPTPDDVPDIIKTAHMLTAEEHGVLRNEAYALVLVNEGRHIRKFACVDAGNTALSTLYFLQNWESLPDNAVKTACVNLTIRCEEFDLPTEGIEKVASSKGMSRNRDPMKQGPYVSDDADWAQRTNLLSVRGGADSGRVIPTANGMKTASIANMIDVSGQSPAPVLMRKTASITALEGRYPLDSYADVAKAVQYFTDSGVDMDPETRHEFCVKTASRAISLGIEVSEDMERYGSTEFALDVDAHLANRRAICEPEWIPVFNELQEKRAHMEPMEFAKLLEVADREAGLNWHWGSHISDPFYATFGGNSEKLASDWAWEGRVGDHVNAGQLKNLAINGRPLMHKHFSSEIVSAFQQDPIAIFDSLPDTSKTIISRLANDMHTDGWAATN